VRYADQIQTGQSKGTAYVQFRELRAAQMALDAMNGFDLAGRQSESHIPDV
jgi:RNA recognition motif-containing protein